MNTEKSPILFISRRNRDIQHVNLTETEDIQSYSVINITSYIGRLLSRMSIRELTRENFIQKTLDEVVYTGDKKFYDLFIENLKINCSLIFNQLLGYKSETMIFARNLFFDDMIDLALLTGYSNEQQAQYILLSSMCNECDLTNVHLNDIVRQSFGGLSAAWQTVTTNLTNRHNVNYEKLYRWLNIFTIYHKTDRSVRTSDNLLLPATVDWLVTMGYEADILIMNDILKEIRMDDLEILYTLAVNLCMGSSTYASTIDIDVEAYKFAVLEHAIADSYIWVQKRVEPTMIARIVGIADKLAGVICDNMIRFEEYLKIPGHESTITNYLITKTDFRK